MKIYKNEEMVGNDRIVRFSLTARDGYEPVGFIDPSNNELGTMLWKILFKLSLSSVP